MERANEKIEILSGLNKQAAQMSERSQFSSCKSCSDDITERLNNSKVR